MRRPLASAALIVALAGCAPTPALTPAPPPPPRPAPRPVPPPPAAAIPPGTSWQDWPASPGTWRYRDRGASFGTAVNGVAALTLRCEGGAVILAIAGPATSATIRTSSLARTIALQPGQGSATARLSPADPLLDAMGFSRGRFVLESRGAPPLVVPAAPEVLRVAEDCRR